MKHFLKDNSIPFVSVHGEQKPSDRKGLLNKYQNGDVDVIVCTDLGSRGINTIRVRAIILNVFKCIILMLFLVTRLDMLSTTNSQCSLQTISTDVVAPVVLGP
jgi:hypothetical protein